MSKLSISHVNYCGQRTLMRVDFNVPLDADGKITDDKRIVAAMPSIQKLIDEGAQLILCSHLGRPKGKVVPEMSLRPCADRLAELLGQPVKFAPDCIGPEVEKMAEAMNDGDILLLENLRFHKEETDNDPEFSKQLARLADVYVNDAFGSAHRAHASTEGVTKYFDSCAAGFLMEKEIKYLGQALENPIRPFSAILGGAKVSGKIDVIEHLFPRVNSILIGGGMMFTFIKAMGKSIGKSLIEEDRVFLACEMLETAEANGVDLVIPVDCVVADEMTENAKTSIVDIDSIPDNKMGLDIGPKTIELFKSHLKDAKTVIWNGPMGVFEIKQFSHGTYEIAQILADITALGATTIVGGGDSASAVKKSGLEKKLSHISTGGGASLEYLEGKILPGLAALTDV
ncbi:MAG: phosphoglycerate kinase [Candidatus Zixiibacteriota bacterium]